MPIPSKEEYERNEAARFHRDLREIERAPLRDRQEACREFFEAMRDRPNIVAERVGWLLDGNYGKGAYDASREVARNTRMNRVAWLTQITGALEWRCPPRMLVTAWKKLTSEQKDRLKITVERALSRHLAEDSNGRDPRHRRRVHRRAARRLRANPALLAAYVRDPSAAMPRRRRRDSLPSTPAGARAYKARIDAMMRKYPGDGDGGRRSRSRRSRRR